MSYPGNESVLTVAEAGTVAKALMLPHGNGITRVFTLRLRETPSDAEIVAFVELAGMNGFSFRVGRRIRDSVVVSFINERPPL